MSALMKKTVWSILCGGCLAEYGGPFFAKAWAEEHRKTHPLCPDCDGEYY